MEKRRSKGVTIFAWSLIILNIFTLLLSLNFKIFFNLYRSFNKTIVIGIILYSLFSMVVGIASGFGILKLKEIMRKIAIAINSLDVLFSIPLFLSSVDNLRQYSYLTAVAQAGKTTILSIDVMTNIFFYSAIFASLFYIFLSLLLIFFFTRPNVKEQFK